MFSDDTVLRGPAPRNEESADAETDIVIVPPDGPCRVRGTGIMNSLHFAHLRGGTDAMVGVMNRLAPRDHERLHGIRKMSWYPFGLHCRVLRAVDLELGNGDFTLLFDLGRHSASRDFPSLLGPLMRRGRPGWILDVATKLWRLFHGEGQWHLERSPREIIARLEGYDEADAAFCASFLGYVTGALEISGASDVEGTHLACRATGAPSCIYTVRWS